MSDSTILLKAVNKPKPTEEIGAPGLKEWGGFVREEFVTELQGQRGAQRYREMVDNCPCVDTAIKTMVNVSIRAIQDGRIEPFSQDSEDVKRAEHVEQCFEDMASSRTDMDTEALSMFEYGYAPMEIVYKRRAGYKSDEERSSRFDDEAVGWSKIVLRSQESVLRWDFDEFGRRVLGMVQLPAPSYNEFKIPIDRLALFRTTNKLGNPEGRSLLRAAYFAYKFFKRGTAMAWVGAERDVAGIPVLTAPADVIKGSSDGGQGFARLKNIGENVRNDEQACVIMPSDVDPETKQALYSFGLVSSPGSKVMDVPAMTRDQERQILMVLFSDFLLMGHEKIGTQALFGGRMGLYASQLDSLLDRYDEVVNRQLIPRLALMNGWPMDRLPKSKHGTVTETDLDLLGKFLSAYAGAGGILDPDLDKFIREQAGWPEASPEAIDMLMAPPPAPSAPGAPPVPGEEPKPEAEQPKAGEHETDREEEAPEVEEDEDEKGKKPEVKKYSDEQPRDDDGKWGEGGGGSSSSKPSSGGSGGGYDSGAYSEPSSTPSQKAAFQAFQDAGYAPINGALREGGSAKPSVKAAIKEMDSAFKASGGLGESVTVYRGMAASHFDSVAVGAIVKDKGFACTTTDKKIAAQFAKRANGVSVEIRLPKGAKAMRIGKITGKNMHNENEVLLSRGTKFKVVSKSPKSVVLEAM
jgi:hypothetical protein